MADEITMIEVTSTNVAKVGRNPETKEVRVEFKSGITYKYEDVPDELWDEFAETFDGGSVGAFFQANLRYWKPQSRVE